MNSLRRLVPVIAVLLAAGCSEAAEVTPAEEPIEFDGVSREDIEISAEPMSPEEAERLGIVDTTIQIVAPMDPDSVDQPLVFPTDTTVRP